MNEFNIKEALADGFDPQTPRRREPFENKLARFLRTIPLPDEDFWIKVYITWRIHTLRFSTNTLQSDFGSQAWISEKEAIRGNGYNATTIVRFAKILKTEPKDLLPRLEDLRSVLSGRPVPHMLEFHDLIKKARALNGG